MASITERKDKHGNVVKYKFVCCVGRDENNKQIWRSKTIDRPEGLTPAKERKEVNRIADEWEAAQKADYTRTQSKSNKENITLREFIDGHWWPDHVLDGEHTPGTVAFYKHMTDDVLAYFGDKKKLAQIDAEAIKRYIKYLRTEAKTKAGGPLSAATIQHHFATLRNVLEYAKRFHYIKYDPCQDLSQKEKPHRENKKIDFLTPEQAQKFMAALNTEPMYWRCFMNVLITTGLRRGEAVGLQWGDINRDKLEITVQRNVTMDKNAESKVHIGSTKTKEARVVPVSMRVYSMLMQFKAEQDKKYGTLMPNAFIFCSGSNPYAPIYPTVPTRWQRRFVERHNLPKMSPHDLRHTAATLALESGADLKQIQELLGHKDPSTTMSFYAGVTEEAKRRTVEGIESLIG